MELEQKHYLVGRLKEEASKLGRVPRADEMDALAPRLSIPILFGSHDNFLAAAGLLVKDEPPVIAPRAPRVLVFDIECKPMQVYAWGLFDQNIGIDMIIEDWSVMSWAAKWIGQPEIFYQDVSQNGDYAKDELIVLGIYELLSQADVLIGQNSIKFDLKKLKGKFEEYGLPPLKPIRHIDLLQIKKRVFGLTSNKLAFSTEKFNSKYRKLDHSKYPGFSLWAECLKGNQDAWLSMREYNIHDVLATEELYERLKKHDNTINYGVYTGVFGCCPKCGSVELDECGIDYTKTGAFQLYRCKSCMGLSNSKENLLAKSVKKGLLK